jgi:hypothetical protein
LVHICENNRCLFYERINKPSGYNAELLDDRVDGPFRINETHFAINNFLKMMNHFSDIFKNSVSSSCKVKFPFEQCAANYVDYACISDLVARWKPLIATRSGRFTTGVH